MVRERLDMYDELPRAMITYLQHNGRHFNKRLCNFAVSMMEVHHSSTGGRDNDEKTEPLVPMKREEVDELLKRHNIKLKHNQLYDYVYVANMCKADFLGQSVPDEQHQAKYIQNVIDDVDAYDGLVFNRWYADMCGSGVAIDWEDML